MHIVRRKNGLLLAEWSADGSLHRAWVTPDMVSADRGQTADVVSPEMGIPYGVNFAQYVRFDGLPETIDDELKRMGIWTFDDVKQRPDAARQALQSAYGFKLADLLNAAKRYEKDQLEE